MLAVVDVLRAHQARLEDAMHAADAEDISTLARDVYSLLHFPVLAGIVALAAAAEAAIAHPSDPLSRLAAGELAAGIVLYVAGLSVVHRRAAAVWLRHRVLISRRAHRWLWPRAPWERPFL